MADKPDDGFQSTVKQGAKELGKEAKDKAKKKIIKKIIAAIGIKGMVIALVIVLVGFLGTVFLAAALDILDEEDDDDEQSGDEMLVYAAYAYSGMQNVNGENGTGWWWPIGSNSDRENREGFANSSETPALGKANVSRAGKVAGTYPGQNVAAHPSKAGGWAVDIGANGQARCI